MTLLNSYEQQHLTKFYYIYTALYVLFIIILYTTFLYKDQWCSLRDTQVYAVYPLGKDKDLRIPTYKKHADT